MSNLKVAILVPPDAPGAPADRLDTFTQAREISQCLTILGNESLTLVFAEDESAVAQRLAALRPDLVVNLVEDLPDGAEHAFRVTALLDRLGLPYTGAGTAALRGLGDKREMQRRLAAAGLPIPGFAVPGFTDPHRRYIVKSATEHASIGIDGSSVVTGSAAAIALVAARHRERGGQWYAEAYIDGREFNLALLATRAGVTPLPLAEILFLDHANRPKIVGYAEKMGRGQRRLRQYAAQLCRGARRCAATRRTRLPRPRRLDAVRARRLCPRRFPG